MYDKIHYKLKKKKKKKYAKKLTFCNYVPDLVPYMAVAGHKIQRTWCLDQ